VPFTSSRLTRTTQIDPHRKIKCVGRQPLLVPALMHPTLIPRPFHREGWVYEEKVDGYRMVAYKDEDGVRLVSRNGRDHTRRFRELVKVLGGLKPKTFTLDGEVAVFDRDLISRFEWLRGRPKDEPATLPVYIVFDLLEFDGNDLRPQPLKARRRALERLASNHGMIFPARRLSIDGFMAWEEAVSRGYEGIVAKDPESPYVPGRTLKWLKVKVKDYRKEARGFYRK
jgi:bifunctional non-homologous end joining protein LigD